MLSLSFYTRKQCNLTPFTASSHPWAFCCFTAHFFKEVLPVALCILPVSVYTIIYFVYENIVI